MAWRVLLVTGLLASAARADTPCVAPADFKVGYGSVERAKDRCAMIATTDGHATPFSWFEIGTTAKYTLPITVDVTWRRLDADDRSLEIELLGGSLLFREGSWGPYFNSDAAFQWIPVPELRLGVLTTVHAVQYADRLEVAIDGKKLPPVPFAARVTTGSVGFAAKASSGVRAHVELHRIAIHGQ